MPANAAIYISTPPPSEGWLLAQPMVQSLQTSAAQGQAIGGYELVVNDTKISMNIMDPQRVDAHLAGFAGWVRQQKNTAVSADAMQQMLALLSATQTIIGCVIEPDFDEQEHVSNLLFRIAHGIGLIFALDTVFVDGQPILGPYISNN